MHNIVIKTIYIQEEGNIKVNKYFKSSCLFYGSIKKKKTSKWSSFILTSALKPFCINKAVVAGLQSKLQ